MAMDNEKRIGVRINYPLHIAGNQAGDGVFQVGYEGRQCCLVFRQKELGELYAAQSEEAGHGECHLIALPHPESFLRGLESLAPSEVTHVIFDCTFKPSVCKVVAISDLIDWLTREPAEPEEESSPEDIEPPES
jgi:hypothetical protein